MARYKLITAYDGTDFKGFQRQKVLRTVQSEIELALRKVGWTEPSIQVAGRTDTGVHASNQVISFNLDWKHTESDLLNALNSYLPDDVSGIDLVQVSKDFHPRYLAKSRRYRYMIYSSPYRDPLRERYAWRIYPEPNFDAIKDAMSLFEGIHDFKNFGSPHITGGSTVREIYETVVHKDGDTLMVEIKGNAFLYHMVRRIVQAVTLVGQGRLKIEEVEEAIQAEHDAMIQGMAPSKGLTLVDVIY